MYYIIHWKQANKNSSTGILLIYSGLNPPSYIGLFRTKERIWYHKRISHKLAEEIFIKYWPVICNNEWDKTISLEKFAIDYFNTMYINKRIIASYYI